jgi:hypothetical protein
MSAFALPGTLALLASRPSHDFNSLPVVTAARGRVTKDPPGFREGSLKSPSRSTDRIAMALVFQQLDHDLPQLSTLLDGMFGLLGESILVLPLGQLNQAECRFAKLDDDF